MSAYPAHPRYQDPYSYNDSAQSHRELANQAAYVPQSYPRNNDSSYPAMNSHPSYPPPVPNQYSQQSNYHHNDFALSRDSLASETEVPLGAYDKSGNGGRDGGRTDYGSREREKELYGYGQEQREEKSKVMKWIWIGVAVLLLAGAGAGIAVWRVQANKNASGGSASTGKVTGGTPGAGSNLQVIPGSAGAVLSNPNDPSVFQKDGRLHQAFYGMAYTPFHAQAPQCGAVQANVTEDIQLLSQLTTRIRTYGSACNQSAMVLQAIQDTKVNMTVWLGVYIGTDEVVNMQQMTETIAVIQMYGVSHIAGVIVGNEYILGQIDTVTAVTFIIAKMATFRTMLKSAGINLPVGTADAGSEITTRLATGSQFIMANVHPFFGGLPIQQAANWTWDYFHQNDIAATDLAPNRPETFIAETGWPTASMTAINATLGAAVSGVPELQMFLDTFPCTSNTNGTKYFFFSLFDEPWKEIFGGVEPYWGLMDSNKVLKAVNLPSCISP